MLLALAGAALAWGASSAAPNERYSGRFLGAQRAIGWTLAICGGAVAIVMALARLVR
jgi:hypothetical protein